MALLRNYGIQTTAVNEFEFNFEIPTNSNFTTQYDAAKNINTVCIQLNSGQSQPATTYTMEYFTFNAVNGILDVRFKETLNGVVTTKPKIVITNS
jgi:hypothetical protein